MEAPQQRAEGAGPFTTRLTWQRPEGDTVVWESRPARRRGTLAVRSPGEPAARTTTADAEALRRLRRLNGIASAAFVIGGALFALGAAVSQFGWGTTAESAAIYFAGGLFFNTGGYVSLLQVLNGPRHTPQDGGRLVTSAWKWWGYEPMRLDWLSTFVLFTGTLVFGINLLDSFLQGLTVQQTNRLIWTPDVIGCLLFLLSGHLAFIEICHRPWPCLRSRSLGWWVVAVNQFGSVLFMVSALAAFTLPATGDLLDTGIANWGTLLGALCFSAGGVLQAFERP
ncbi:hypothetical protein [Streptomyces erythrochromogenes]|uniref:hypothetical protein n=1 Tax=Streptomyces erythrochromogenes TaxID=285574 RepID=UPI00386EF237|nr:hypothetical protein OG364_35055 [Streptomyces erythrochromogenes]